jgi:alpha-beta hydrolase superfamily lysophospholipase
MLFEFECITGDGLRLYGRGWRPDGTPKAVICLVHGLGEHSGRYRHVADHLTRRGSALLAVDLRGHGRSEGRRGHTPGYETLMEDISHLLSEAGKRFDGIPLFLYGHSMGGNLVINYAIRRNPRLRGVIASAPLLRTAFDPPRWKTILGEIMRIAWPTMSTSNGLPTRYLSRDPAVVSDYDGDPLVHDRVTVSFLDIRRAGLWALERAGDFPLPLLLMHGGEDRITSSQASIEFAAEAGDVCTLKIWDGFYHEVHNEPGKEKVLACISEWLDSMI